VTPIRRTTLLNSGGNVGCSGSFAFDFNTHIASGADFALVSGQRVGVQCWSRDPASLSLTNLSAALEFTMLPVTGAGGATDAVRWRSHVPAVMPATVASA